jgi:Mrp family chromosome partitioning ATPase
MPGRDEGALASYLGAIRSHPWVVALVTLAAVVASAAFVAVRSPSYEATADLLVDPLPIDDQTFRNIPLIRDTGDPTRTVQTAASLVETREIADRTAEALGGDWTGTRVLGAIEVNPVGESNILGIEATADDPAEAARLANQFVDSTLEVREDLILEEATAEVKALNARIEAVSSNETAAAELIAQRDQLESVAARGDPTLAKSQEAVPPTSATGAPAPLVLIMALLAGFVLGSVAAMLIELLSRRVRDEDDALALYPLPVLARIPELPSRKRRVPEGSVWYMPPEIREPFRTLAVQLDEPDGPAAIMVTSGSAGDGKTTTALHLAVSLAASGKSVILLDLDLRKPQVGAALGFRTGPSVTELLSPQQSLESVLQTPSHLGALRVLAPRAEADDAGLIEAIGHELPAMIAEARELADHVVVDTAPLGEVGDALHLIRVVDEILLVVRPGNTSDTGLEVVRDLLERAAQRPRGFIVLSRAERPARGYYSAGYAQPRSPVVPLQVPVASPETKADELPTSADREA